MSTVVAGARDQLSRGRSPLTGLVSSAIMIEAVAGATLVLWEALQGPTIDGGGNLQDHGGYVLGVPILGAVLFAGAVLIVGSTSRTDRASKLWPKVVALSVLSVPLLLLVGAVAIGALDPTLLWDQE